MSAVGGVSKDVVHLATDNGGKLGNIMTISLKASLPALCTRPQALLPKYFPLSRDDVHHPLVKYLPGRKFHGGLRQLVPIDAEDAAATARLDPASRGKKRSVQLTQGRRPGEQQGPSARRVRNLFDCCLKPSKSE